MPAAVSRALGTARGIGLVESMLALVVFSVAIGAIIKVWVQDHQIQQIQRQAEVLQTARLAGQRLVGFYRNALSLASPSLTTDIEGNALSAAINPTSTSGGTNVWQFNRQNLVNLKLLDSNFPTQGVFGSLSSANLQFNLSADRSKQRITGTVCYDQPLKKDGQVDMQSLGALLGHVSRNVSVVGTAAVNGSSYQSGVFVAAYPGSSTVLKGAVSGVSPSNPITGQPAGVICALVGDWGGLENTGRSAYTTVSLPSTCTEPNALAWLNTGAGAQPQNIVWCDGANWKLFHGANAGGACVAGAMSIDADPASSTYLQPLTCGPGNTYVAGRLVPFKEDLTCNASNEGLLATGKTDSKIYRCQSTAWVNLLTATINFGVTTGVAENDACGQTNPAALALDSSSPASVLMVCLNNKWRRVNW
jgi:type II secretory pathway pseudopilin PulG